MLTKTDIKLYSWEEYEKICETVSEGSSFEYVEGEIFWRYTQEIMPIDLIDFILSTDYSWEKFSQLLEYYQLMKSSKEHQIVAANLTLQIGKQLDDSKYRLRAESTEVAIPDQEKTRIPDITLSSVDEVFNKKNQLTNPTCLIEIWSPSTEKIDKTDKLEEYRRIESLQEYIMFSQEEAKAEQYIKKGKTKWENNLIQGLDKTVEMPSVNINLPMNKVYQGVELKKKKK
jgi:Uma2 family endonuclease